MLQNHKLTDEELINKVKIENCSESFTELKKRHGGMYMDTIKKRLDKNFNPLFEIMEEEMDIHFMLFIEEFKPERGFKFVTFVGNRTRYLCLKKIKSYCLRVDLNHKVDDFEEMCSNMSNDENIATKDNFEYMVETAKEAISELQDSRARDILYRRYCGEDKQTLKEVSRAYGISGQAVLNIQTKALDTVRRQMTKKEI